MLPSVNQYGTVARPASSSLLVANRTATPLRSLWTHKWLAVLIVIVVSAVGFAAALLHPRDYEAEATIRISPVASSSLAGEESQFNSNADYRDFVQEQVFEVDNFATATAALDLLGPKRSLVQAPGESDRFAAERLVKMLRVEPVADSYLVRISLAGDDPEG